MPSENALVLLLKAPSTCFTLASSAWNEVWMLGLLWWFLLALPFWSRFCCILLFI
jgi:hypothetical protein